MSAFFDKMFFFCSIFGILDSDEDSKDDDIIFEDFARLRFKGKAVA